MVAVTTREQARSVRARRAPTSPTPCFGWRNRGILEEYHRIPPDPSSSQNSQESEVFHPDSQKVLHLWKCSMEKNHGYTKTSNPRQRRKRGTYQTSTWWIRSQRKGPYILETGRILFLAKHAGTVWNEAYIMLVSCIDYALDPHTNAPANPYADVLTSPHATPTH